MMGIKLYRVGLAAVLAMLGAGTAHAQYSDADIRGMLEAEGTKFEIDKDKDYKVVIEWRKEKRSQVVFVASRTETLGGTFIREIFSPAAVLNKNRVTGDMALSLLKDASTNKLGGWQIAGGALFFVVMLPEPFTAAELDSAINVTAEAADNQEIKVSGTKDEL